MNRSHGRHRFFATSHNRRDAGRAVAGLASLLGALTAVTMSASGCGRDGPECVPVSGTVTWNGEPLPSIEHRPSRIYFIPAAGNDAPSTSAEIINGEYTIEAKGGVHVGKHRVRIEAYRPPPQTDAADVEELPAWMTDDVEGPPVRQFIPPRYNQRTELEIVIEPGSGPIRKDFELSE